MGLGILSQLLFRQLSLLFCVLGGNNQGGQLFQKMTAWGGLVVFSMRVPVGWHTVRLGLAFHVRLGV